MQIINMKLSEIHPYEKNPRFNDGAVEAVANSIKEFGFQQPIVVDKDLVVAARWRRLPTRSRSSASSSRLSWTRISSWLSATQA